MGAGGHRLKKKPAKKIDDIVNARRQEIDAALTEIIDQIEKWFLSAPFHFVDAGNSYVGEYLFDTNEKTGFNRFYDWNDVQMCKLFPSAREAQINLEDETRQDHSDELGELAFASQRFEFVVGVLVGMKAAGFSREEFTQRAQGFVIPVIGHLQWSTESNPKSAGVNHG
jgi:hypothetical protein